MDDELKKHAREQRRAENDLDTRPHSWIPPNQANQIGEEGSQPDRGNTEDLTNDPVRRPSANSDRRKNRLVKMNNLSPRSKAQGGTHTGIRNS